MKMPNFTKGESKLESRLDKRYAINNLEDFQSIPTISNDDLFERVPEKAELVNPGQADLDKYENSLKVYRDLKGVIDTAFDDGKKEVARLMKQAGEPVEKIEKYTGLSKDEINKL